MKNVLLVLSIVGLLVFVACGAKVPQEKIDAAKKAMDEVKQSGADAYAPEALKQLTDKNAAMESALNEKKYEEVGKLADEIKTASADVIKKAQEGKDKAKADAQAAIDAANTAITAAGDALTNAPTGKGSAADLKMMGEDLETAKKTVVEAKAAWDGGRYVDAKTAAEGAQKKADEISQQIQAAIDLKKGAK